MLRLEVALPDRPDEVRPTLDNDALREDGPDAIMLVGDSGLELTLVGELAQAPRWRSGISAVHKGGSAGGHLVNHTIACRTRLCKARRTTLDFVRLGVVSDVRRLGFCYLHKTIFLNLCQRNVGLVPL